MSFQTPSPSEAPPSPSASDRVPAQSPNLWWPYVAPMFAFLLLTSLEGYLPKTEGGAIQPAWYAAAYALKVLIVTGLFVAGRAVWVDLKPWPKGSHLVLAAGLGLLVAVGWVGLQQIDYPKFGPQGTRVAFDPSTLSPAARWPFLAVRLYGLVLLIPLVEEIFWRSFVLRMVIGWERNVDFHEIPVGVVTMIGAVITAVLFASVHPEEWLPAVLTGLLWAGLLAKTRSLWACVVSHMVANLGLGIYVLTTRSWEFW